MLLSFLSINISLSNPTCKSYSIVFIKIRIVKKKPFCRQTDLQYCHYWVVWADFPFKWTLLKATTCGAKGAMWGVCSEVWCSAIVFGHTHSTHPQYLILFIYIIRDLSSKHGNIRTLKRYQIILCKINWEKCIPRLK